MCRGWRKDASREASWRKESPREDANPTIQSSPSQSPSIHPSTGVSSGHSDRDSDWPRESGSGGVGYSGDEDSEKDKAAAAAAAAAKPPMMILKRPTPPSTPQAPDRQSADSSCPPALSLSPASKVFVIYDSYILRERFSTSLSQAQCRTEEKEMKLNPIEEITSRPPEQQVCIVISSISIELTLLKYILHRRLS